MTLDELEKGLLDTHNKLTAKLDLLLEEIESGFTNPDSLEALREKGFEFLSILDLYIIERSTLK